MAAAGTPNLDLSLDDMIAANNTKGRRRGGVGGNNRGNSGGTTLVLGGGGHRRGAARKTGRAARGDHAMPYSVPARTSSSSEGSKIMVSNLHFDVTAEDLKELFSTQIGPLRKVVLSFDQAGRSRGVAEVVFRNEKDARIGYQRFNGVTLDGRPMKIEIILQPNQIKRQLVVGRPNDANSRDRSSGGARGRGRARRVGNRGGGSWPAKSVEDLDAEMAAYMSETTDKPVGMDADTPM